MDGFANKDNLSTHNIQKLINETQNLCEMKTLFNNAFSGIKVTIYTVDMSIF